ncbi:Pheromone B beta 1 receptor [Asterophora parasitica]|uniref:Pheromone B beta 1 receptor n=1 Tax=Asterophora parasitica TaxID=117018 RepID=A0A9P7KA56_9AGAR|nr:Pheromone B beta 1 receptor [Asterophora parasitica]
MHPEFLPVALISALSVLIVLPWHWRAGNVATLALAFWLFISNIIYAVDAAIWGDNANIVIPVWCDITSKLIIGSNFGLPAACLCICIHLERVASVRQSQTSITDRRRRQIFEALMCFGLPLFFMGLHFVVQGHRFDIIEEHGCRPTTYFSIAGIFIVWLPPLVVSIASLVYSALALRHFMIRRVSFAAHLNVSQSALTTSRYLRLMLMAALQMIWGITTTSYALWFTVIGIPLRPWTTWDDVHSDFSRIDQYYSAFTPQKVLTSYYVLWWFVPVSTWIFVAFFAFGADAMEEYKKCFMWFRTRVLRQTVSANPTKHSFIDMFKAKSTKSKLTDSSNTAVSSTIGSLPPYTAATATTPNRFKSDFVDFDDDACSEISNFYGAGAKYSYSHDLNFITSPTEVSSSPPSPPANRRVKITTNVVITHDGLNNIPLTPLSPPSPLAPPPRHPRLQESLAQQAPTSPRPYTYPSHDALHRAIGSSPV